jgi:hypothetical protein
MDVVPFSREQCEQALRKANFLPETAASILFDGGDEAGLPPAFAIGPVDPPDFAELVARLVEVVQQPSERCTEALRRAGYDLEVAAGNLLAGGGDPQRERPRAQRPKPGYDDGQMERRTFESFTEAEREQIFRLQEITGRPREYVIEIFLACDKDEEATCNCLLEGK